MTGVDRIDPDPHAGRADRLSRMTARLGAAMYQAMTPDASSETIAYGMLYNRTGRRQAVVSTSARRGHLPAKIVRRMAERGEIIADAEDDDLHAEERIMLYAERTRAAAATARVEGRPVPEEWWVETIGAGNPIDRDRCAPKMAAAGIERATPLESLDHAEQRRYKKNQALAPSSDAHRQWQQRREGGPRRG